MLVPLNHAMTDIQLAVIIKMAVLKWQDQDTRPYTSTFDIAAHDPNVSLNELRNRVLDKEQEMLQFFPYTNSGKIKGNKPAARVYVTEAYEVEQDDYDEDNLPVKSVAQAKLVQQEAQQVRFQGRCGICKEIGHNTKDCSQGWWCETCKWVHRKGTDCDKG
jgi:hypothetical protein